MRKGLFVTFEGPDASGKSLLTKLVSEKLKGLGYEVVTTREPGGTKIGEDIRQILLSCENKNMFNKTEALLFAAARAQHVEELIKPAIKDGKIILCDRWLTSSLAYQGEGRKLGDKNIMAINDFGIDGLRPDVEFILNIEPDAAFKRIKNRDKDRIEHEDMSFHDRVNNYFKHYGEKVDYVVMLDGENDPNINADAVVNKLMSMMDFSL